jgi:hypothetical protein
VDLDIVAAVECLDAKAIPCFGPLHHFTQQLMILIDVAGSMTLA